MSEIRLNLPILPVYAYTQGGDTQTAEPYRQPTRAIAAQTLALATDRGPAREALEAWMARMSGAPADPGVRPGGPWCVPVVWFSPGCRGRRGGGCRGP